MFSADETTWDISILAREWKPARGLRNRWKLDDHAQRQVIRCGLRQEEVAFNSLSCRCDADFKAFALHHLSESYRRVSFKEPSSGVIQPWSAPFHESMPSSRCRQHKLCTKAYHFSEHLILANSRQRYCCCHLCCLQKAKIVRKNGKRNVPRKRLTTLSKNRLQSNSIVSTDERSIFRFTPHSLHGLKEPKVANGKEISEKPVSVKYLYRERGAYER